VKQKESGSTTEQGGQMTFIPLCEMTGVGMFGAVHTPSSNACTNEGFLSLFCTGIFICHAIPSLVCSFLLKSLEYIFVPASQ
jgi:hypothetical protein